MPSIFKMFLVAALASATVAPAEVVNQSKDIVVTQPKDLPEVVQVERQSMNLHELGNGRTYLYIEQQQLSRLVILDVTEPARIKPVAIAKLDIPVAFDLARPLSDSAIRIAHFRNVCRLARALRPLPVCVLFSPASKHVIAGSLPALICGHAAADP